MACFHLILKIILEGFPGGSVVKNLPANAGDMNLIPDPERSHMPWGNEIHAPQWLSLCSRAKEAQPLSPRAATIEACMPESLCSATRETPLQWGAHTPQLENNPLAATREKPTQ